MIGDDDFNVFYNPDDYGTTLTLVHPSGGQRPLVVLLDTDVGDSGVRTNGRSNSKTIRLKTKTARVAKSALPADYSEYLVLLDGHRWRITDDDEISPSETRIVLTPETSSNGQWLRD